MATVAPYGLALALRDKQPERPETEWHFAPDLASAKARRFLREWIKRNNMHQTGGYAGPFWSDPGFENAVRLLEDGPK